MRAFHEQQQCESMDKMLHWEMKEYFSLDSVGISKPTNKLLSTDDQRAEALLRSLIKFKECRYETGLLWRSDDVRLPDNHAMTIHRHRSLETRLTIWKRDTVLQEHQRWASFLEIYRSGGSNNKKELCGRHASERRDWRESYPDCKRSIISARIS